MDAGPGPLQRLAEERDAAARRVAALERELAVMREAADGAADDEHDPDGSSTAFERAQVAALLAQARDELAGAAEAAARLAGGGYGTCEGCGRPIPPERLAVRPSATRCVPCASGVTGRRSPGRASRTGQGPSARRASG